MPVWNNRKLRSREPGVSEVSHRGGVKAALGSMFAERTVLDTLREVAEVWQDCFSDILLKVVVCKSCLF